MGVLAQSAGSDRQIVTRAAVKLAQLTALHLRVESFERIVRPDLTPMPGWKCQVGQYVGLGAIQERCGAQHLRHAVRPLSDEQCAQ
jgi:hypothetical protein